VAPAEAQLRPQERLKQGLQAPEAIQWQVLGAARAALVKVVALAVQQAARVVLTRQLARKM